MIDTEKSPVARAPKHLRDAFEAAKRAYVADGTESNWAAYCAAIRACIDHDDRERTGAAA